MQHPEEGKWVRHRRAREMRSERTKKEHREALTAEIDSIRSGANLSALWFLQRQAQEKQLGNRWGEASMEPLRELYGDDIAEAAEQGWRAFWRTCDPSLPHERERNTTPGDVIVGLVGLTMDFELGLDAGSLTEAEITKAARYAANELNGFPKWFGDLAAAQADSVRAALRACLEADYQANEDVHGVLAKLPWAEPPVKEACAPAILELILEKDPPTLKALKEALGVVLADENLRLSRLDAAIPERCRAARGDVRRLAVWWLAWAGRDGAAAMDFFESLVGEAEPQDAYEVVLEICHRIHGGIERSPTALSHDPAVLTRLIPIVYGFIQPKDDIHHEDVFSPGRRDNAQEVKSSLVRWLADTGGAEVVQALRRLAGDPRLAGVREWILHQADLRALANVGSRKPDVVDMLVTLYREHGLDARNHLAQTLLGISIVKILLIGSNPQTDDLDELAIDEEARDIEIKLRASEHREAFQLKWRGAARPLDLQQILLEERPTIVHFSGHGAGADGLIFHSDRSGEDLTVPSETLRDLFRIHGRGVRVVVLNACDSVAQARVLRECVDFVVGMQDEIADEAARVFASAFYRGLGFGSTVQDAFDQGVLDLRLAGMTDDAAVPILLVREGLSAADSTLVASGGER
jgi:hypothetical protein